MCINVFSLQHLVKNSKNLTKFNIHANFENLIKYFLGDGTIRNLQFC